MKKTKKSTAKKVIISVVLFLTLLFLVYGLWLYIKIDKKIDINLIKKGNSTVTKIFYFDFDNREQRIGTPKELKEEAIFSELSEWESFYNIPDNLKNAFIAIEDKRFYEHNGVDWLRTGKALINYIFHFDKRGYGGSTITQQLIKNITGENDVSPKRKVEEIFRAINIEKSLGKNEILEAYLNIVYLSQNCYGVGAASKLYFNKNVSELSLAECASLASIVQNPLKYDPYSNPINNVKRKNVVLKEMLSQSYISKKDYDEAISENIVINNEIKKDRTSGIYSWYTEALLSQVCNDMSSKYNLKASAARRLILKGGFNIYSLVDPKLQKNAEKIYSNYMAYIDNQNGAYPQSSCVILDPQTSDVLALVGGVSKKNANLIFNRAIDSKRPIGSVIKPISVYLPALENGLINYSTVYDDTPVERIDGKYWPKNSPNVYRGLMPACYALAHSVNTVPVKMLRDLGINNSIAFLNSLGINIDEEKDKNESSLALGQLTNGESLLNVTNAYTPLANGGKISKPKTYLKVTDNIGNVILEKEDISKQIISSKNAYIMTKMLCNVVNEGTAACIKLKNKIPVAGKTGTTSNNEDKWFIGYTPYYICGVWTGFDTPLQMNYKLNPSCIIFDELMEFAHMDLDLSKDFDRPYGIIEQEFCFDSGDMPSHACERDPRGNRVGIGYYSYDNFPMNDCNIHKMTDYYYDIENKKERLPLFFIRRKSSFLDYNRKEYSDITILDDEYLLKNRKKN